MFKIQLREPAPVTIWIRLTARIYQKLNQLNTEEMILQINKWKNVIDVSVWVHSIPPKEGSEAL